MAAKDHRRSIDVCTLFLLIILIGRVESQPPSRGSSNSTGFNNNNSAEYFSGHFNPYTVIIIVVLISAFFLLGFFSIYIRQCGERFDTFGAPAVTSAAATRFRLQRGLIREVLESFPTLVYSEVKEHKIGKGALECAICLNEFEDEETIRLVPNCDHVFHLECIDAWLDTHVTCPVCRTNYADYSPFTARVPVVNDEPGFTLAPPQEAVIPEAPTTDHVVNLVDDVEERKEEMRELARIASRVRGNGARRSRKLSRSYSTGQYMEQKGEVGLDRYTLRLPENVRKEIIAAGKLKRARTFGVIGGGEASMRGISRGGGEASIRRNRTIRLGRSDQWPSFLARSLSAKMPAWGNWRKGDEGSSSRKINGAKPMVDFRAVGGGAAATAAGSSKSNTFDVSDDSTIPLNRV